MLFRVLTIIKALVIFLTKLTTGRIIEDVKIDNKDEQKPRKPTVDTQHKIEFSGSGYTASVNSIITFCFSILACYTIFFFLNIRPKYIQIILNYNLLTITASFILLYIIDNLIPRMATKIVECIVDLEWELAWKEWKRFSRGK